MKLFNSSVFVCVTCVCAAAAVREKCTEREKGDSVFGGSYAHNVRAENNKSTHTQTHTHHEKLHTSCNRFNVQNPKIQNTHNMPKKRKRGKTPSSSASSKKRKNRTYCKEVGTKRCWGTSDERMRRYHDEEWANTKYHFESPERLFESMTYGLYFSQKSHT